MNKLIICVGISGAGKSTWVSQHIKQNKNYLRINRDDIRKTLVGSLVGYYKRPELNKVERIVDYTEDDLANSLAYSEFNIIIDNTNLKIHYINKWKQFADKNQLDLQFKIFQCDCLEAIKRVIDRDFEFDTLTSDNRLEYIEKQYQNFREIKNYLELNYKNQII